jgi:sugar lactone lactonase YvrE
LIVGFDYTITGHAYKCRECSPEKLPQKYTVSTLGGQLSQHGLIDGNKDYSRFSHPRGVAVNNTGEIFIADGSNHRIRRIMDNGTVVSVAGSGIASFSDGNGLNASFSTPMDLDFDSQGNIIVVDYANDRIRKINNNLDVETILGNGEQTSINGIGLDTSFYRPNSIAIDKNDNFYITETHGTKIRKVDKNLNVTDFTSSFFRYPQNISIIK